MLFEARQDRPEVPANLGKVRPLPSRWWSLVAQNAVHVAPPRLPPAGLSEGRGGP